MRPSQINAIDRIELEAAPQARDELIWFYRDLVELEIDESSSDDTVLRFRSARVELRIKLIENPRLDSVRRRALISVRSVIATAEVLDERHLEYTRVTGFNWSDRRLSLLDPGGNRVELKQEWRSDVFGPVGDQTLEGGDSATAGP